MTYTEIPIIPIKQKFYNCLTDKIVNWEFDSKNNLDLKAIASFCYLGFMLDDDTFYDQIKVLRPSTKIILEDNNIKSKEKIWEWHYNPTQRTLEEILEEFTDIFENIVVNKSNGKKILLPISGGLDSRTLFVPVKGIPNLTLAAYEFEGGINETRYGKELAECFSLPLYTQKLPKGYLWSKIEKLIKLNNCFSEFTHPRQLAVLDNWKSLGDIVLLGHMGDLLFESQTNAIKCSYDEQLDLLIKNIVRPGGYELASDLWSFWGLDGTFDSYILDRLDKLYGEINIDHPSSRMRAFKSSYYVPRGSSINISIFRELGELVLPYCENEMCKFICTVPERYLKGRKIQIEYIKKHCPEAAYIPWQKYYPLNLYQYQRYNHPVYYPMRAARKLKRIIFNKISNSPELLTRNWELQFLGDYNFFHLKKNLTERNKFNKLIPSSIILDYLKKFQINPLKYAHPVSMLLTMVVFSDEHYLE
jgi:hypothetical protein